MKPKILLINVADPWLRNGGDRPSLGTLYLASWLMQTNAAEPRVIDMNHCNDFILKNYIEEFRPDIIGISLTTPQYYEAVMTAGFIKNHFRQIPVIAGGAHPTAMVHVKSVSDVMPYMLFDYVVIGDGELALESICKEGFPQERIIYSVPVSRAKNLDWQPQPARELVSMGQYSLKMNGKPATCLMTSKGCPYHCVFCSEPILNGSFRAYSPEKVLIEMEAVRFNYGIDSFIIYDDVFTIDTKRVVKIAELLKGKGFTYRCTTRASDFKRCPELADKLAESGCIEVCIGTESGSNEILKLSDKGMTVEQNSEGIRKIKSAGMKVLTYMITGLPGCSRETEEQSLQFMLQHYVDNVSWYMLAPFPSTLLWINRDKYGCEIFEDEIIANNWDVAQCRADNEKLTCYIDYSKSGGLDRNQIKSLWLEMLIKLKNRGEQNASTNTGR